MTRRELRDLLEVAIVEWATEHRDVEGDMFATASELENIKSDPLGFADLLPGDTQEFLRRLIRIQQEQEDAQLAAELAHERRTQQTFWTSDGYRLRYDGGLWTDGDLEFNDEPSGWPVDAEGVPLVGHFMLEGPK